MLHAKTDAQTAFIAGHESALSVPSFTIKHVSGGAKKVYHHLGMGADSAYKLASVG